MHSYAEIMGGRGQEAQERAEWALLGKWDAERYAGYPRPREPFRTVLSRERRRELDDGPMPSDPSEQDDFRERLEWRKRQTDRLMENRARLQELIWDAATIHRWWVAREELRPKLQKQFAEVAAALSEFGVASLPDTPEEQLALARTWTWPR